MIEPVANTPNYQLAQKLLDASVVRHRAIASNIANAETPGYRRIDVAPDFATTLRSQFAPGVARPDMHALSAIEPRLVEDASVRAVRPDGNTVELETELLELGRNQVDHEFLTDLVSRHIKQLKVAISGRVV